MENRFLKRPHGNNATAGTHFVQFRNRAKNFEHCHNHRLVLLVPLMIRVALSKKTSLDQKVSVHIPIVKKEILLF